MNPRPPAWLRRLLEAALPGPLGAEVRADLEEGFRRRSEEAGGSRLGATVWYLGRWRGRTPSGSPGSSGDAPVDG